MTSICAISPPPTRIDSCRAERDLFRSAVRQIDLPKQELRDLAELCPGVTHSLQRLYAAYTEARRGETLVAAQMADRDEGSRFEPTRSSGCAT